MSATASIRLLAFTALGLSLTSCEDHSGKIAALQDQHASMSKDTSAVKALVAQLRTDVEVGNRQVAKIRAEREAQEAALTSLEADLGKLQAEFAAYKQDYRKSIRQRASSLSLGDLTLGGRTFKMAKVRTVNDVSLVFTHAGGIARVAMKDVGPELQTLLAWDPAAAIAVTTPVVASNTAKMNVPDLPPAGAPVAPGGTAATGGAAMNQTQTNTVVDPDGSIVEILSLGTIGQGSTVTGSAVNGSAKSTDPAYKPIGSSFTGSMMDRIYAKPKTPKK